jgi:isoleucyl-tRNA synthetase
LVKLFAPIMPFLSEMMHQNLVVQGVGAEESVHWCDFPKVDESLIDAQLSADMEALLRLVSLGSAARNSAKIKVRQPLAEMRVQPGDESDRRAVERFADQICEELNVKKVTLHEPNQGPLLRYEIKPNMKTLGPKFGSRLKTVLAAVASADPAGVADRVQAGQAVELASPDGPVTLEATDLIAQFRAPEGWAGVADRGTQVLMDTRITEELAREGMAREVVRHVQNTRKDANLEMEDRIVLSLQTQSAALAQAIAAHRAYICSETLAVSLGELDTRTDAHRADVKVDGQPLSIELRKR